MLLVHPAFAKHLAGWGMGLHRVVDIVRFLETSDYDWEVVHENLVWAGVQTAAWTTLRWVQLLTRPHEPQQLDTMLADLQPGPLRRRWLDRWLERDLSARLRHRHWLRLLAFTSLLHDTPADMFRALAGRARAWRRRGEDLRVFETLRS